MMCVVGFVFITGWFGVRFSIRKIIRLLGVALFAALMVHALEVLFFDAAICFNPLKAMRRWWFLNSYLELLLFCPILNCLIVGLKSSEVYIRREAMVGILFIVSVVYFLGWPMERRWIPTVWYGSMAGACSTWTMCAIYLVARVVREFDLYRHVSRRICWALFVGSCIMAALDFSFSQYNSPVSLVFALSGFSLVRSTGLPKLEQFILYVSPSMFFVYLFHSLKTPGFVLMASLQDWIIKCGSPIFIGWVLTALAVFTLGVGLDICRRLIVDGAARGVLLLFGRKCK